MSGVWQRQINETAFIWHSMTAMLLPGLPETVRAWGKKSRHIYSMNWTVEIADEFEPEFDALDEDVQNEILALSRLLQHFGPQLGRPRVDTLNGSRHANMKELRFGVADGEWRLTFAFDPARAAQGAPAHPGRRPPA